MLSRAKASSEKLDVEKRGYPDVTREYPREKSIRDSPGELSALATRARKSYRRIGDHRVYLDGDMHISFGKVLGPDRFSVCLREGTT